MLAILDYNAGNQTSVKRALEHLNIPCKITNNPEDLYACKGVIFPGVGSAAQAMQELHKNGLDNILREVIDKNQPLLGICLGCQILLEKSQEGPVKTLAIESGDCKQFVENLVDEDNCPIKIPHMGWNRIKKIRQNRIWDNIPDDAEFYFVHSYYVCPDPEIILATTHYGLEFCSVYGRDGLWAAQFHPEKSGRHGLTFLKNFYSYCDENSHAI